MKTIRTTVCNGVQTIFPVTFDLGYLDRTHVFVYVGDTPTNQVSYTWINNNAIETTTVLPFGTVLNIRRITPRGLFNDYTNGAILEERNLDDSFKQPLMLLEEVYDGFMTLEDFWYVSTHINMGGRRITGIGTPVDPSDAATKKYIDTQSQSAADSAAIATQQAIKAEQEANRAEAASTISGFYPVNGSFELGGVINERNQVLLRATEPAAYFSWGGELPKEVPASSTVEGTGGEGITAWTNRNDATLAGALAAYDSVTPVGGVKANNLDLRADSVQSLISLPQIAGKIYNLKSYHTGFRLGGGRFYWDASRSRSEHNGGYIIDPSAPYPTDWNNQMQLTAWFNSANAGTGCFVRLDVGEVNISHFGAKGIYYAGTKTGVNDVKSIQKAIDYATAQGLSVSCKGFKENYIPESVFITCEFDGSSATWQCKGGLIDNNGYAVYIQANKTIGTGGLLGNTKVRVPQLINIDQPTTGWSGQCSGLQANNLDSCIVDVKRGIVGFQTGFSVTSYTPDSGGTAYNDFHLGRIIRNNVNLFIQPVGTGYVNENNFYSGKMGDDPTNRSNTYVALLPPTGQGFGGPNANKFYGLTVEDGGTGTLATHLLIGGLFNLFIGTRFEFIGATGKIVFWREDGNEPTDNLFVGGYSYGEYAVTATSGFPSPSNKFKDVGRAADIDGRFNPIYGNVIAGGSIPYFRLYDATKNLHAATVAGTDWVYQVTNGGGLQTKVSGKVHAQAQLTDDRLYLGTGDSDINEQPYLQAKNGAIGTTSFDLLAGETGAWNQGHLRLGQYHLWVDSTGDLRIKYGKPTSDMDGAVVGTQS